MTDFRDRYKRVGYGREDVELNRALRSQRRDEARRDMRSEHFSHQRILDTDQDDTFEREERELQQEELQQQQLSAEEDAKRKGDEELEKAIQKRLLQLEKWREERHRKKLQEKRKAKPVFKVGVVHHRIYSPPLNKNPVPPPPPKLCKTKEVQVKSPLKKVTRATEKRMAVKALVDHQKRENLRSKTKDKAELNTKNKLHKELLVPKDHQFKAPVGVTPIPMFGRQALEASKANMEWGISSTASSTISDSTKSFAFDSSQSILGKKTHSIILSQSSTRRSKTNKLCIDPCDTSINNSFNDSLNNSSVEAVSLKISSDDQEMLDDQENVDVNHKLSSSFSKSSDSPTNRRSSKIIKAPLTETNFNERKINPENSNFSKQSQRNRRSLRIPVATQNSTLEEKVMSAEEERVKQQEIVSPKNNNTSIDSNFSKHIESKTAKNRRRSTRVTADESMISEKTAEDTSFTVRDEKIVDNSEKSDSVHEESVSESLNLKQTTTKSPANRRRSIRMTTDHTVSSRKQRKDASYTIEDHEILEKQENVDFNMDSSLGKKIKTKSSRKKKSMNPKSDSMSISTKETSFVEGAKVNDFEDQPSINDSPQTTEIKKISRSIKVLPNEIIEKQIEEPSSTLHDHEMIDDQNNIDINMDYSFTKQNKMKSLERRRSMNLKSNFINRSTKESSFTEETKASDFEDQVNTKDSPKTIDKKKIRRSVRILPNESIEERVEELTSFHSQEMPDSEENVDSNKNTSFSQQNKMKSPERRKSIVLMTDSMKGSIRETSFIKEVKAYNSKDQTSTNDSLGNVDKKKTRRSTRILPDDTVENPVKEPSFIFKDQEMPDVDSNNFTDSTFFGQTKNKSPGNRKSTNITPDESLIKFSPRQSIKLQPKKSPANHSVKVSPTKSINESTSSEPIKGKSPKNDSQNLSLSLAKVTTPDMPPAFFSPYIVASRGKSSSRKEVKRRRFSQPVAPEDIPTKDTVMQNLNISVEEEERAAQYYKYILDKEIERLNELCDKWNEIKQADTTPEDIQYEILAAVGQTQLLINKKFARFRSLVLDCETGKGEMLVTYKDLQGFWEMMYMEIRDCDNRFSRLEELKARNWVDEQTQLEQSKPKKPIKKPAPKKKTAAKPKTSSLRAHIMAARKKKTEANGEAEGDVEMVQSFNDEKKERFQEVVSDKPKDSDDGSPGKISRRTSTPNSSKKWQSLLKKVQLSQSRKSTTSPLIVMKLSQMCKTPEVQLDDSIVYINSDRTPAKSILKTSKDETLAFVARANKVFFKEEPNEVQEFERNEEDNIDDDDMCLDNIKESKEPIERKLNFESDSFIEDNVEGENSMKHASSRNSMSPVKVPIIVTTTTTPKISMSPVKVPKIAIIPASPVISMSPLSLEESKSKSSIRKNSKKLKKQISFKDEVNENYTRNLRSSKFLAPSTPIPKLRNTEKDDTETMEIDNSIQETNNDSASISQQDIVKEFYLNSEGIFCERIVPVNKGTPTLRRSNSEKSYQSPSNSQAKSNAINKRIATPRLRRRITQISESELHSPTRQTWEITPKESESLSTPKTIRLGSKRSFSDATLTEDNINATIDEATTPKIRRKSTKANETDLKSTPATLRRTKSLNIRKHHTVISDSVTEPVTPKLRRTNSKPLSTTKNLIDINNDIKETGSPKLKRTNSKLLNRTKTTLEENSVVSTPNVKRSIKNLPEPNEQETDQGVNTKVLRVSSIKRTNSKKRSETIEQQSGSSRTISEALTPNRRKSLRIALTKNEDC